jgi:hypothetical protein
VGEERSAAMIVSNQICSFRDEVRGYAPQTGSGCVSVCLDDVESDTKGDDEVECGRETLPFRCYQRSY